MVANPAQRNPAGADLQDAEAGRSPKPIKRYAQLMTWVDEHRTLQGAHQRRRAEAGARGDRLRRRGHRPVPHRAHVLRPHRRLPRDDPGRHARGPRKGPGQVAAASAEGFRRHLPGHEGPAGDDPPARSAAARVPAALGQRAGGAGEEDRHRRPTRSPAACRSCTSSTRCSATAAAAWASSIRRSRAMQARAIFEAACDVQEGRHRRCCPK